MRPRDSRVFHRVDAPDGTSIVSRFYGDDIHFHRLALLVALSKCRTGYAPAPFARRAGRVDESVERLVRGARGEGKSAAWATSRPAGPGGFRPTWPAGNRRSLRRNQGGCGRLLLP